MAERTLVRPPWSRLGTVTDAERQETLAASPVAGKYDRTVDRESAHEILAGRAEKASAAEEEADRLIEEFRRERRYGGRPAGSRRRAAARGRRRRSARQSRRWVSRS